MAGDISLNRAARQLGISRTRLRNLIGRLGIMAERTITVIGLSPADVARIRRAIDNEANNNRITMKVACERLKMSHNTLRRRLESLGIVPQTAGQSKVLTEADLRRITDDDRQEWRYRRPRRR